MHSSAFSATGYTVTRIIGSWCLMRLSWRSLYVFIRRIRSNASFCDMALTRSEQEMKAATPSPDGRMIAFVWSKNIQVYDLMPEREKQLTRCASEPLLNGIFSWVYWEEISGSRTLYVGGPVIQRELPLANSKIPACAIQQIQRRGSSEKMPCRIHVYG